MAFTNDQREQARKQFERIISSESGKQEVRMILRWDFKELYEAMVDDAIKEDGEFPSNADHNNVQTVVNVTGADVETLTDSYEILFAEQDEPFEKWLINDEPMWEAVKRNIGAFHYEVIIEDTLDDFLNHNPTAEYIGEQIPRYFDSDEFNNILEQEGLIEEWLTEHYGSEAGNKNPEDFKVTNSRLIGDMTEFAGFMVEEAESTGSVAFYLEEDLYDMLLDYGVKYYDFDVVSTQEEGIEEE